MLWRCEIGKPAIIAGHKCGGDGYVLVRVGCGAGRNPGVLCYREGRFHHFVELDLAGNLIRAVSGSRQTPRVQVPTRYPVDEAVGDRDPRITDTGMGRQ